MTRTRMGFPDSPMPLYQIVTQPSDHLDNANEPMWSASVQQLLSDLQARGGRYATSRTKLLMIGSRAKLIMAVDTLEKTTEVQKQTILNRLAPVKLRVISA